MKKIRNIFIIGFIGLILFVSCGKSVRNTIKEETLAGGMWLKGSENTFEFNMKDTSHLATLTIDILTSDSYCFSKLIVYCKIVSPSGSVREKNFTADIRDNNGDRVGKKTEGGYEHHIEVFADSRLNEKGKYSILLRHDMPNEELKGVEKLKYSFVEEEKNKK